MLVKKDAHTLYCSRRLRPLRPPAFLLVSLVVVDAVVVVVAAAATAAAAATIASLNILSVLALRICSAPSERKRNRHTERQSESEHSES